jgi:hypothetical protein
MYMDQVDLSELGIAQEAFSLFSIVLDKAGNIPLGRSSGYLFNQILAKVLEERVERLIKLESFLNRNLAHDGFILTEELSILLELFEIVVRQT